MARSFVSAAVVAAALFAAAPAHTEVDIDINIGVPPPPPIVMTTPPVLVVVPHSSVYYAPSLPYNFFFYAGRYYTLHAGVWFWAPRHSGPWTYVGYEYVPRHVLAVPTGYYKVPPGHLKKKWHGHRGHGRRSGHHKKHGHDDD